MRGDDLFMFEWYAISWVCFENKNKAYMWSEYIELWTQNMVIILSLIVNIIGETYITI